MIECTRCGNKRDEGARGKFYCSKNSWVIYFPSRQKYFEEYEKFFGKRCPDRPDDEPQDDSVQSLF